MEKMEKKDLATAKQEAAQLAQSTNLEELRKELDGLDAQLLEMLNKRAMLSLTVGAVKGKDGTVVFHPARETFILNTLAEKNMGPLPHEHIDAIWREIFSSSRSLQQPQQVAFLGPLGTFSHMSVVDYFGSSVKQVPLPNFAEIFTAVVSGAVQLGVVPLENSLHGTVGECVDLFLKNKVYIQAEFYSCIQHSLFSKNGVLEEIKNVYSHPQPLAQCGNWLKKHLPQARLVPVASTADGAAHLEQDPYGAVIGQAKLAELYNLTTIASKIQDSAENWTRFAVIAKNPLQTEKGLQVKSSFLCVIPDKAGALAHILVLLAKNSMNMSKLESRPLQGGKWEYVFFMDVECDITAREYEHVVQELQEYCLLFQNLGAYPMGMNLSSIE